MAGPVPKAAALSDIYPPQALATQAPRWNALVEEFTNLHGHAPAFVARSPGRVNIIGEHIDYSLYPVLPMAITADALLAIGNPAQPAAASAAPSFTVKIANLQSDKFPSQEFAVRQDGEVDIDSKEFVWTNYFKSGLKGAMELLRKKRGAACRFRDLEVVMDGTVPVGGGLSSSAAFVSASALAVMVANGEEEVDRTELTELAIVSERAVGVNSGGMDQSASVLSEKGAALHVSFAPRLSAKPIFFPPTTPELNFLIAQSFVTSNKHVTGPIHYNLRVVEVSLAAAYLHATLNPPGAPLPADAGPLGVSLQGFHETYIAYREEAGERCATKEEELGKLIDVTKGALQQEEGYTREEIARVLGVTVPELEARFMAKFPVRADRFKLRQRALHVFTESLRVHNFLALLARGTTTADADPAAAAVNTTTLAFNASLGSLMNETQESCRDLYECSCPEIDEICRVAREAGAYGSRLTGAGWGGCTVHLVPGDKVEDVKRALEERYYKGKTLSDEEKEGAVVVSKPGSGAAIYVVGGEVH